MACNPLGQLSLTQENLVFNPCFVGSPKDKSLCLVLVSEWQVLCYHVLEEYGDDDDEMGEVYLR